MCNEDHYSTNSMLPRPSSSSPSDEGSGKNGVSQIAKTTKVYITSTYVGLGHNSIVHHVEGNVLAMGSNYMITTYLFIGKFEVEIMDWTIQNQSKYEDK